MPQEPQDIHRRFADAVSNGDINALADLYEPGATVIERDGQRTEGIQAIRQHLEHLLAMKPTMTIKASSVHCQGQLALLSSHWTANATIPDGSSVQMEFHGSELARQQPDGTWRLILDNPWGAA